MIFDPADIKARMDQFRKKPIEEVETEYWRFREECPEIVAKVDPVLNDDLAHAYEIIKLIDTTKGTKTMGRENIMAKLAIYKSCLEAQTQSESQKTPV